MKLISTYDTMKENENFAKMRLLSNTLKLCTTIASIAMLMTTIMQVVWILLHLKKPGRPFIDQIGSLHSC